jgi:hypothetical protein
VEVKMGILKIVFGERRITRREVSTPFGITTNNTQQTPWP